ncbi:DUF3027 domain-containing protein, partial [Mycobacterium tuberculosis]|uniref:DUF3027 domain-containing protein n=1 Tax=Mycobacterium tuberculosis TaxID=1773 RepID=UPI000E27CA91
LGVRSAAGPAAPPRFLAPLPGSPGWPWAVVVARSSGAAPAPLRAVVLVPGPPALLAPAWVPWAPRVRPGALRPG